MNRSSESRVARETSRPAGRVAALARTAGRRIRERAPKAVTRGLRLTAAAVASYLVASAFVSDARPVTAALTALLVVQVTLVGTIKDTALRIVAVILGVGLAILFSAFVPFSWWSLGMVVAVAILVGQGLQLGEHLLEVPISAMLILAVGGAGVQALDRVTETLIGAAIGLLVNVLVPPAVQTRTAGAAVDRFAGDVGDLLDRVAAVLADRPVEQDEARQWLHDSRSITHHIAQVDRVLTSASQSRRLNPRAVGTTDATPDIRDGLDALEHATVALRAVFRSLADAAAQQDGAGGSEADGGNTARPVELTEPDLRQAIAALMSDLALAVRQYGALIRAEVDAEDGPHGEHLAGALDSVREARARLTELLLVDPRQSPGQWQLHGSLLAGVERVLAELDLEERARRRERRRRELSRPPRPVAEMAGRLRQSTRRAANPAALTRGRRDAGRR